MKNKYLIQLKKDINSLEYQIKHYKLIKAKNNIVSNLKIYYSHFKKFIPCIIVTGFSALLIKSSAEKINPKKSESIENIKNNQKIEYEIIKNNPNKTTSLLYKYKKIDDKNKYLVTIYDANNLNDDILNEILKNNDNINLSEKIGKPINEFIMQNESSNDNFYKIIKYTYNQNDVNLIETFSTERHTKEIIEITVIAGLAFSLNAELIKKILSKRLKNDKQDNFENDNYELDIIKKQLVIKQNNYQKLTGDKND